MNLLILGKDIAIIWVWAIKATSPGVRSPRVCSIGADWHGVEHRHCARYCAKYFMFIISLHSYNNPRKHCFHFSDEETENLEDKCFN